MSGAGELVGVDTGAFTDDDVDGPAIKSGAAQNSNMHTALRHKVSVQE
jgi:hypothetical protein